MALMVGGEGGAGEVMENPNKFEASPLGFCTLTKAVPTLVRKLAGTRALSCVELTKTVESDWGAVAVFHCTTDPLTKFVPVTAICSAELPETTELGVTVEAVGWDGAEAELIVKTAVFDPMLPGF